MCQQSRVTVFIYIAPITRTTLPYHSISGPRQAGPNRTTYYYSGSIPIYISWGHVHCIANLQITFSLNITDSVSEIRFKNVHILRINNPNNIAYQFQTWPSRTGFFFKIRIIVRFQDIY